MRGVTVLSRPTDTGYVGYLRGAETGETFVSSAGAGYAYETGQGTDKNPELALQYYVKGAALGEEHCREAILRLSKKQ